MMIMHFKEAKYTILYTEFMASRYPQGDHPTMINHQGICSSNLTTRETQQGSQNTHAPIDLSILGEKRKPMMLDMQKNL